MMDDSRICSAAETDHDGGNSGRSEIFAGLLASISNEGWGDIGLFVQARMYVKVPSAQLDVELQRYEESGTSFGWKTVDSYYEEYSDVNVATFSKTVSGFKTGYQYRVRATAEIGDEVRTTASNGVLIKDGPGA